MAYDRNVVAPRGECALLRQSSAAQPGTSDADKTIVEPRLGKNEKKNLTMKLKIVTILTV